MHRLCPCQVAAEPEGGSAWSAGQTAAPGHTREQTCPWTAPPQLGHGRVDAPVEGHLPLGCRERGLLPAGATPAAWGPALALSSLPRARCTACPSALCYKGSHVSALSSAPPSRLGAAAPGPTPLPEGGPDKQQEEGGEGKPLPSRRETVPAASPTLAHPRES